MSNSSAEFCCDVAIIGAGFTGAMTAVHLLGKGQPGLSVALMERNDCFGQGVAYGTREPAHLLNVPAAKMSAFPDQPEHFLAWLREHPETWAAVGLAEVRPDTFVPRCVYGSYLKDLLSEAEERSHRLRRFSDAAIDVQPLLGGQLVVRLKSGRTIRADKVVLALGVFPPGDPLPPGNGFHDSPAYLHNPWDPETQARLSEPGDVLILGSGLTALDLLLTLRRIKQEGTIHVLSRHGFFPQPHRPTPAWPAFLEANSLPDTILKALRLVRAQVDAARREGVDWRAVIDGLRPFTQAIWQNFSIGERRRFLRHLRPLWESHRHRAAPRVLAVKDELERSGRLICQRGRLAGIAPADEETLEVAIRIADEGKLKSHRYIGVVNCTGPDCNYYRLDDPLIERLLARRLILPDPLRLGLEVSPSGTLRNGRGLAEQLFTLGSPLKGRLLETTAVPELRVQAKKLAEKILADSFAAAPFHEADEFAPDPAFAFEI